MIPTSQLFRDAMPYSTTMFAEADIVKNGAVLAANIAITGGTVTTDRDSNTRYKASGIAVAWDKAQTGTEPPLVADGRRVRIRFGVSSIGYREALDMGTYLLTDFEDDFRGGYGLSLEGLETLVIEDRFIRPRTPPYGASTVGTITALIQESVPDAQVVVRCSADRRITATASWEKERWDAITELAESILAEVYCGHDGRWYIVDTPNPAKLVPVAKVIAGPSGVAIEQKRTSSRDGVYNAWVVSGQSSDAAVPPVWAFVYDSDPASPTYYGAPTGALAAAQAAELIRQQYVNDATLYPDWTWDNTPTLVSAHRAALLDAYRGSGSPGPTPQAWLTSYVATYGNHTVTSTVIPPMTQAALAILGRLNSGKPIFEDWTWKGMPVVVGQYNSTLQNLAPAWTEVRTVADDIHDRIVSGAPIFEDWTWDGMPDRVNNWQDFLVSEFYRVYRGTDWPKNKPQAVTWLREFMTRPDKAFLQDYIATHPPVTTDVFVPTTLKAQAAELILIRLTGGLPMNSDWTWPGIDPRVAAGMRGYRQDLLAQFRTANKAAATAWLSAYIAANTASGEAVYTGGTFGKKVGFYSSQFFTADSQCLAYAQRKLGESLAYTSQMSLSARPLPYLEAGDAVQVGDERGRPLPDYPVQLLNQTTTPLNGSAWNAECQSTEKTEEAA